MLKKLKELWNKFDVWMMMHPGRNLYLWDWWELVKNPFAWLIIIVFVLLLVTTANQQQPQETISLIYENGEFTIIK